MMIRVLSKLIIIIISLLSMIFNTALLKCDDKMSPGTNLGAFKSLKYGGAILLNQSS